MGHLIIPNSVTSIGATAFSLCEGFNGNLRIGKNAFYWCWKFKKIKNNSNIKIKLSNFMDPASTDYFLTDKNEKIGYDATLGKGVYIRNGEIKNVKSVKLDKRKINIVKGNKYILMNFATVYTNKSNRTLKIA